MRQGLVPTLKDNRQQTNVASAGCWLDLAAHVALAHLVPHCGERVNQNTVDESSIVMGHFKTLSRQRSAKPVLVVSGPSTLFDAIHSK